MKSIQIGYNKTLKLTNVLVYKVDTDNNDDDFSSLVIKMENYIKTKGAVPIGPLIQKNSFTIDDEGQIDFQVFLMRQTNNFIHHIEEPYKMESILRVKNCMYAHYVGPEEKLKLAYDKINVTAFEEDIELSNESYTIFVDQQDDNIVVDVFVEKEDK